ncbi:metallophosphoesterase family protein [Methylobacterium persicinum]|uniref:3',5'-cyclic AMP phosphodiesterase CpdA n=1 Tax=Methylobacterium persicinum TaxID=374426 RepID=A0ABU0HQ47_9HYPH|nr:metallophosphoesterase [Methylobacterium persicinum]MDQ0444439.1 3',5'-cyclic AMP phosphodiesterase CpdA [Methylobacterium persicinum]GJE39521.1 3',5'-cyclic adenosine monophosphate phosphodiesterase CpdA [Methylobacterium persicinum]
MPFRLAHLSDPHVGPLGRPRLHQLFGKRATGYANWQRGRSRSHDMATLSLLVADLRAQGADHVACTGDLCNIGLPSEWATARAFMEALGPSADVSLVPGNHDAYVRGSLEGLLASCGAYITDDSGVPAHFPYLRRRGPIALVGLSSAIPTKPFVASGRLGPPQLAAAETLLRALATEPGRPCRVVMIHHPPHPGGASPGRELKDAAAFAAMIGRVGAELVMHGHNHVASLARMAGPGGFGVPVVGVPSASALPDGHGALPGRRAGYALYEFEKVGDGYAIAARRRGLDASGVMADLGSFDLKTAALTGTAA